METHALLVSDGSASHSEIQAKSACLAFPPEVRGRVSDALQAVQETWSAASWQRKLELVKAEAAVAGGAAALLPPVAAPRCASPSPPPPTAASRRAASNAAFEVLLSGTARPDFDREFPPCPDVTLSCASSGSHLCLTLQAAEHARRNAIHCIIALDISGSMDHSAVLKTAETSQETQAKFSRLDLAKHSSKVIVEVMGDDDFVTILSFGSEAEVRFPKTRMTAEGECIYQSTQTKNFRTLLVIDAADRQAAGAGCHRRLDHGRGHKPHRRQPTCPFVGAGRHRRYKHAHRHSYRRRAGQSSAGAA
jgi:hypothetical protein